MAKAIPNPEPPRKGGTESRLSRLRGASATGNPSPLETWNANAGHQDEDRYSHDTRSVLHSMETDEHPQVGDSNGELLNQLKAENDELKAENHELRSLVEDLQQELEAASGKSDQNWGDRQKEYESLLDEKTELIRSLHLKIQEVQEQQQQAQAAPLPKEDELQQMSEELERERCQLQQERRRLDTDMQQLKEDSEIMTQEMRQMEVQMARERADIARQRSEVQRINEEIRHELERIERDRGLSERLTQLRQRHVDVMKGRGNSPGGGPPAHSSPKTQLSMDLDADAGGPPPGPGAPLAPDDPKRKDSGLFRRFFGQKE